MPLIRWLALLPPIGMLAGPIVNNNVQPLIFGMPFPLGWITIWVIVSAAVMGLIYALDPANREDQR